MPAQSKNNKSKAVVGSKKKSGLLSRLDWKRKVFLGTASAVLILSIGFTANIWWQNKQVAGAYSWQVVASNGYNVIRGCKTTGGLRFYVSNYSPYYTTYTANGGTWSLRPYTNGLSHFVGNAGVFAKTNGVTLYGRVWPDAIYVWC